jgi:DNA topoisomerase I
LLDYYQSQEKRMVAVKEEVKETAKEAGLSYVTDSQPGITRKRAGKGWSYAEPDGTIIKSTEVLARIKALVLPPAWTHVWICPSANGHIQATGLDDRGRKQYRYHAKWREMRDADKYGRMMAFGGALPKIRKQVEHDLALPGLPREKVLATVVRLLETTLIRVGNEEYARTNKSFGLTTMRNRHVKVDGWQLRFKFRGKSGKTHSIGIKDRRLARIVRQCQEMPGQDLFEYVGDDKARHAITSSDVNAYLKEITGEDFTAKDFRTWAGTTLAALALQEMKEVGTEAEGKRNVTHAIESVAERLGNTPAVCRKCYVHPEVIASYLDGSLAEGLKVKADAVLRRDLAGLPQEEAQVMVLLHGRLAKEAKKSKSAAK